MTRAFLDNLNERNALTKQRMLELCINFGSYSLADLGKELNISVPTITKLVGELIDDGWLEDLGKQGSSSGRRPSIYGLNPNAGYFAGVDLERTHANIAVMDFKGQILAYHEDVPFTLQNTVESCRELCELVKKTFEKDGLDTARLLQCGMDLTGRVNTNSGYSFTYFISEDKPLSTILEDNLGVPVSIDNDSRAMTFGEYMSGAVNGEKDILFINASWGLGMGIILDGSLFYGNSGFSGEIGHFPMLENDVICRCGKVGCLETGASGSALQRIVTEKIAQGRSSILSDKYAKDKELTLKDILDTLRDEDVVVIEAMEEVGTNLGKGIAGLINVFNPELIVIGGKLIVGGDYLMLPVRASVKKHSLNLVSRDTTLKFSRLGRKAGSVGSCMLARSRFLGLM